MPLVDAELIAQYRRMSAGGTFPGRSIVPFGGEVRRLIVKTGSRTVLDYGCGGGLQYAENHVHRLWGLMPTLYDPGVERYATRPTGTFDGVLCCDVLEHVPESDLVDVLADIFGFAQRFVFLAVCCRPASKALLDGRNAHVTVQPEAWWRAAVEPFRRKGLLTQLLFTP